MELNLAQPLSSISVIFIVRDTPLDFGVTERLQSGSRSVYRHAPRRRGAYSRPRTGAGLPFGNCRDKVFGSFSDTKHVISNGRQ